MITLFHICLYVCIMIVVYIITRAYCVVRHLHDKSIFGIVGNWYVAKNEKFDSYNYDELGMYIFFIVVFWPIVPFVYMLVIFLRSLKKIANKLGEGIDKSARVIAKISEEETT